MAAPQHRIIPAPVTVEPAPGNGYEITVSTVIHAAPDAVAVAELLAATLRPATGFPLPVRVSPAPAAASGAGPAADLAPDGIRLLLTGTGTGTGTGEVNGGGTGEGYRLEVATDGVVIRADQPAGLFLGGQTLRQLLPPAIESGSRQPGPWPVPALRITDQPRYAYRGAMLDVARHFFDPTVVMAFLDRMARYKLNHLHLHLTDDQGWRLAIESWPELARLGGRTQVGGGPGGFYTQDAYRQIVAYARARHITIVPEIDMPGHTNAALAAYPALTRDGVAPEPYTGMKVGFSTLFADLDITYRFVADVLAEVAALTPGPYLHIGGDEAYATTPPEYAAFLSRVQPMVTDLGKTVMGWQEAASVDHTATRVLQYWRPEPPDQRLLGAVARGARVVMSPANRCYLDMRYTADTPLGLDWAGPVEVRDTYDWDPDAILTGPAESAPAGALAGTAAGTAAGTPTGAVLGVEAPLWSETVTTSAEIDFLVFPRLPALAEVAWSDPAHRDWDGFRRRLAGHGPRWRAAGITFHPSPQVPWE